MSIERLPEKLAINGEVRKIPAPIMVPTMMQMESMSVKVRLGAEFSVGTSGEFEFIFWLSASNDKSNVQSRLGEVNQVTNE
jgi:hypothetical protein